MSDYVKHCLNSAASRLKARFERFRGAVSIALVAGGLALILFPLATEAYGYFAQARLKEEWESMAKRQADASMRMAADQKKLYGERRFQAEREVLEQKTGLNKDKVRKEPFPKTRLMIEKIGVDQVVLEGTDVETLKQGPGHYPETVNPGDQGNVAVAGHRVTYTHPFNRLDELVPGDIVKLETLDGVFEYKVSFSETSDSSDTKNLKPTEDARLTLTTCTPKYSAQYRLNVVATLSKTTGRETGVVAAVRQVFRQKKSLRPVILEDDIEIRLAKADKALKKNPKDVRARIQMAEAYLEIERFSGVIRQLAEIKRIDPKRAEIAGLEGEVAKREQALRAEISTVEDKSGADVERYLVLGELLTAGGRFAEAVVVFESAVRLEPYAADILFELAKAQNSLGERDRAINILESALTFSPDYKEARDMLDSLVSPTGQ
ncbi:MAG: sortase [Candidatus Aquicultorales bacterium]